ncbi:NAD(P)/FAD-dependent oxidoreductase [Pseudomaricurvus sp.]|uniref:NAD(P)/FAD-dependent oxidoreductase n=1 Tax=Pseudomaricurvus sp. TaxID=2004510 RepID=UPI003F6B7909
MTSQRCNSYYTASINQETDYPQLEGEVRVDVAIIGGGFTGVATAVELAEKGLKVAIIEANKIGWGATGRNGGQVTGSLSGDQAMTKQLRKTWAGDAEEFVWNMRWRGHDIIKKRVEKYGIHCDLKHGHLQAAYKPSHMAELEAMHEEASRRGMGDDVQLLSKADIPDYLESPIYHGGLLNTRNMHLHSLNLCIGEARAAESMGALIFENSPVEDIIHGDTPAVVTAKGRVTANSVLLAGNAYHKLARKKLMGTIFPASLGNLVTKPLGEEVANAINPKDLAVYDCRFVLDYYRLTADKRLMFGGGTNYSGRDSKSVANELRPAIEKTFPRLKGVEIEYEWTGMAGIVINRIPQLGKLSDHVFYCQGYSGHGVATTHIMGEIMANAISGSLTEFDAFANMNHIRIPLNEWFGNQALAAGMWYYKMLEKLR